MSLYSGTNAFWSAFNNKSLIDKIEILNKRNKVDTVMVFDFSSPHTKIQILKSITKLYDLYRCQSLWLYLLFMSRTRFRVNPHSIVCLNVKELLVRSRREIWSLSYCNWTWTQNQLVRKRSLNHLANLHELSGSGCKPSW